MSGLQTTIDLMSPALSDYGPPPMKIVSDFDGVVTEQTEEAELTRALFIECLAGVYDKPHTEQLVGRAESTLKQHPHQHGWRSQGRITAYANEDLFVRNQGLAACLDDWARQGDDECAALSKVLHDIKHVEGFLGAAEWAYQEMCKRTAAGEQKPLDNEALHIVKTWSEQGHEVVVVSNSSTQRIIDLFKSIGLHAADHEVDPTAKLRVRGGAKKFELGHQSKGVQLKDYWIDIDRPAYLKVLQEERPQMVIGDVFSLDLALPWQLAQDNQDFRPMALCLRKRHYTPVWAHQLFAHPPTQAGIRFFAFDQFHELNALVS